MLVTMQTYYELLRVQLGASSTDIVAAYHAAKGMVSQSLRDSETIPASEAQLLLQKLEEAFQTLSDPKRRSDYDEILRLTTTPKPIRAPEPDYSIPQPFTGSHLRHFRESQGLTFEDVFKATKIPLRYLKALEDEDKSALPSRVYVQGFVKNLAQLYHLPPAPVSSLYLEHLETLH